MTVSRLKRAALHNLGCKVNAYETEAMSHQLEEAGYEIVDFQDQADVYIINTCSVTNMADRKSRQMLHRAKKRNPDAVIVAAGCYVQTAKDETHLNVDADIILGNNRKKDLVEALENFFKERKDQPYEMVDDLHRERNYEYLTMTRTQSHTRAFIKVQDGCNQFCSYCIIPYARGRVRSRRAEDIREELTMLAKSGVREVVLTGIHLTSYGTDIDSDLLSLIRMTASVEGIERIRLGSLEPGVITEEFARALSEEPKFCPHFHLSLQSGSNTVLKRMNRHYTAEEFLDRCDVLRRYFDDPALTTDVIVGFPGETEEEFEETKQFLSRVGFYETHIFRYSMRAGTRAAAMPDQIPEHIKAKRSEVLIGQGLAAGLAYEKRHVGKESEALFEEKIKAGGKTYYVGHTREYMRVVTEDLGEDLTNQLLKGTIREEKIEDASLFVLG